MREPLSDHASRARAGDLGVLAALVAIGSAILLWFGSRDRAGFAEEAVAFRQALTLWGWGDSPPTANPHFFSYPTLSIYWHWLLQCCAVLVGLATGRYGAWADAGVEFVLSPHYLVFAGRVGMTACLVLAAWMAYRWSRSASGLVGTAAATGVCLSPALIRSVLQMTPEVLMTGLGMLALLELRRAREGEDGALFRLGLLTGALCGTKYSALAFLGFCLLSLVLGAPRRGVATGRVLRALLAACGAFLLTTPYALLAPAEFARDVGFELDHLARGHLGGSPASTALAHAGQLWRTLGPGFVIALLGYVFLRPLRVPGAGLLLGGACAYVVPACLSSSGGPERYIVPAIPMLVLFGWEVTRAALQARPVHLRTLGFVLLVLGGAQLVWHVAACVRSTGPSAVACASEWLRANARTGDVIVQDAGSVAIFGVDEREALLRSSCLRQASGPWRARAESAVPHTVVTVPFVSAGRLYADVGGAGGRRQRVVLFDPAWNLVPAMYAALEEVGYQYFCRNSSIEDRLGAALGPSAGYARGRPAPERRLESCRGPSGGLFDDGEVAVYSGGARSRRGALGARWWLRDAKPLGERPSPADSASYELAVEKVYGERVRPFLLGLAQGSLRRGDAAALARAARLLLVSGGTEELAVRFALLGLDAGRPESVWDATGTTLIPRSARETDDEWRVRVLRAWGVEEALARAESQRFADWRRTTKRRGESGPGR